ncbi:DUF1771-domain-containing protein [Boletus reticuloceps]|uniref:DUF1771-domain-containing protein n=1 Tax=Boletus reticuloceps TaxID=495285 RepID=A0A8I3A878_9AGAM|nr:DUF1771-domain-containing protein [Boletus reticuloceps]
MGLTDLLLALVNVLCGGSTTQEQPPSEYQKPHAEPQETITTPPEPRVAPDDYRQEKPISEPHVDHRPRQDQNQINQHDEHYMALRAKANERGDMMAQCFQQSHEAYGRRDGARAKELSEQGKQHERTMENLNAEASAWIFRQNNQDRQPGEVDLHGLYVKEAISYTEKSIQEARQRGDAEIRLIVGESHHARRRGHHSVVILGKGLHSDGHVAKVKPAIEDLMKKHNMPTQVDPHNEGVLIAQLC